MKRFIFLMATVLFAGSAFAAGRPTVTTCQPNSVKISGTWQCFTTLSSGESSGQVYTFIQSGNKFYTADTTSHRLFGTIQGTEITISEVVSGEELEGFVKHSQGHIISVQGKSNNGIVTVYRTSAGGTGSFNCLKQ